MSCLPTKKYTKTGEKPFLALFYYIYNIFLLFWANIQTEKHENGMKYEKITLIIVFLCCLSFCGNFGNNATYFANNNLIRAILNTFDILGISSM